MISDLRCADRSKHLDDRFAAIVGHFEADIAADQADGVDTLQHTAPTVPSGSLLVESRGVCKTQLGLILGGSHAQGALREERALEWNAFGVRLEARSAEFKSCAKE